MAKNELVFELTQNEFPKVINDKKTPLVIVDFFATWCFPCTMMAPVFHRLAEKYKQVKFAKIDVDDASDLANEYEVSSIPCIVFFKDGKEVDRVIGGVSEEILEEKISDYLKL
jgi:thioredoxin 1